MRVDVTFQESNQTLPVEFGAVNNVSDGGYERGYAAGYKDCEEKDNWKYVTLLRNNFEGAVFPENHELTVVVPNLKNGADISSVISGAKNLKKLTLKCGRPDITFSSYFSFGSCASVEEIDLSQFSDTGAVKIKKANYMFYACGNLKTVRGVLDFSECSSITGMFDGSGRIQDVRIAPNSLRISISVANCGVLSDESVQSIIDGLADLTGGTSAKVTFHATIKAKLTEEQLAQIAAKNWTVG